MYGDQMEQSYNLDFFLNYGVPAYALIIEGDTISNEVLEEVEKFFATTLKGSNHKMLTLATQAGVKLTFERLSVETKEASFMVYRKENRDAILTAHNVPPYRASIVEQGALGGSVAEETDRIYLDSVINPRQREFAWVINEFIIQQGFEIEGWDLQFEDINIANAKQESEIIATLTQIGVLTPNEARQKLGLEPYDGGDVFYVGGQLVPVGGEDMTPLPEETNPPEEGLTPEQKRGEAEVDFPKGDKVAIKSKGRKA
jgi:capsid portal protein